MTGFICSECRTEVDYPLPTGRSTCFKCHVKTVRLGFSNGKEDFHGPTIRERQQQQVADAAAAGRKIEPVGTRWI
jgi:hypothetical protein